MKRLNYLSMIFLAVILLIIIAAEHSHGFKKRRPMHHEYANVVINKFSEKNKIAPVVFNHWLHRAKYTCRLCHVDLKFAMRANGTGITEGYNKEGLYCGACHNGNEAFGPIEKGEAGKKSKKNCDSCHSYGKDVKLKKNFYIFTKDFPRAKFGNGINWIKAEKDGVLSLKDYLEGVSDKRELQENPSDIVFEPREDGLPLIIFSHKKHAVWNGCELCHPALFGEKKNSTKFTMEDIFDGKFCGTCHGKVSFPTLDCQRCHIQPIIMPDNKEMK